MAAIMVGIIFPVKDLFTFLKTLFLRAGSKGEI